MSYSTFEMRRKKNVYFIESGGRKCQFASNVFVIGGYVYRFIFFYDPSAAERDKKENCNDGRFGGR